ncbi:MAG: hypothetical protein KBT82_00740 [Marinobacter sp.]|uniref:hypothetical protein n=1 Tax=Marinobacter sp. TaxID=50741 RepID=UPI001B59750B|nr:hypothetical protein [Marinobacter sp.]MBQ0812709.1 hypothetical protein [Marinobacter sp.]
MKKKLTGSTTAAISMFLISGVFTSVLGARQFERYTTHEVLGINGDWPAGITLAPAMLRKIRVDKDVSGIPDPRQVVGLQLNTAKRDGELLRPVELKRAVKSWLAQQVPEGKVLYTMAPQPGAIPHTQLRNGDSFDVIATGRRGVRTVARDVRLIGVSGSLPEAAPDAQGGFLGLAKPKTGTRKTEVSMVVAVAPEYIYPLAHISPQDNVSIVLHGENTKTTQSRAHIDPRPTHRQIEVVSGLKRKTFSVAIPKS